MNKERRKEIALASAKIEEAKNMLESCLEGEQEYYDNMPENLQSGEKGDAAQSAIDALHSAIDHLEDVVSDLEGIE